MFRCVVLEYRVTMAVLVLTLTFIHISVITK